MNHLKIMFAAWVFILGITSTGLAQDRKPPQIIVPTEEVANILLSRNKQGEVMSGQTIQLPVDLQKSDKLRKLRIEAHMDKPKSRHKNPQKITLGFLSEPCYFKEKDMFNLSIWMDGKQFNAGLFQPAPGCGEGISIGVIEIPYRVFAHMTNAKQVKMRFSDIEFSLTEEQLATFRELVRAVNQAK